VRAATELFQERADRARTDRARGADDDFAY
jgi:hypothetical protein